MSNQDTPNVIYSCYNHIIFNININYSIIQDSTPYCSISLFLGSKSKSEAAHTISLATIYQYYEKWIKKDDPSFMKNLSIYE